MIWVVCFILAVALLGIFAVLAVINARRRHRAGKGWGFAVTLLIGVVSATFILFVPVYMQALSDSGVFEAVFVALHSVMRLFTIDGDFVLVSEQLLAVSDTLHTAYSALLSVLFVMVPLLSSVVALSFVKTVGVYRTLLFSYGKRWYVFSELNEKSLALAESVRSESAHNRCLLLFTDVYRKHEEESSELSMRAEALNGICMSKDILTLIPIFSGYSNRVDCFLIGENETENVNQAVQLISNLDRKGETGVFVFATQPEAELLVNNTFKKHAKQTVHVRMINDAKRLVYGQLDTQCYELFFANAPMEPDGNKTISAVVLGMGRHGTEMVKALSWVCQMDGYNLRINAFDRHPLAASRFASQCPELMHPSATDKGEKLLDITIHSGVDITSYDFDKAIQSLPSVTYVLVALGNDSLDVTTAIKLRTLCEGKGWTPRIQAVVYNSDKADSVHGITNHREQPYNIECIGSLREIYSSKLVVGTDSEQAAYSLHRRWGDGPSWSDEYNYRASLSMTIHKKLRIQCGIPGADQPAIERTVQEQDHLNRLEHRRWMVYMRTEGYRYAPKRNDLARQHPCLVPYDDLSEMEKCRVID